jgi:isopropylmalate/homocitrate/citramalate synthase
MKSEKKLRMAKHLKKLGVDVIEAGFLFIKR